MIIWFYNTPGNSVLIAGLFHASFNTTVNILNDNLPAPAGTFVLIGTAVAVLAATLLVVLTTEHGLSTTATPTRFPGRPPEIR
jgi:hypothetical protein